MEASALSHTASAPHALLGRSPLLRLQSDEKLVMLTRRGNPGAFDALVHRYHGRLHSFCRHMLGSSEDAEDVLQEVFASAYNAILADDRPINARPWLYRIARNRSLNHLRRPVHAGHDSMDVFERAGGETTADAVHRREDLRLLVADVQALPESQRTALLMREIDALSYDQIAEAMETTVPSVKSLLVRARVGLAEAAEARMITCDEVRLALAGVAEGIAKASAPVRRHVKGCERCRAFRAELRRTGRALTAVYPVGPLVIFQKLVWGKLGGGAGGSAGAGAGGSGAVGGSTVAGGSAFGGGAAAGGSTLGGLVSGGAGAGGLLGTGSLLGTGVGAIATKAAAGLVAAAVVTAGAVEIGHLADTPRVEPPPTGRQAEGAPPAPEAAAEGAATASQGPATVAAEETPGAATPASGAPAASPATTEEPPAVASDPAPVAATDPVPSMTVAPDATTTDGGVTNSDSSTGVTGVGGSSPGSGGTSGGGSPPSSGGSGSGSSGQAPPGEPGGSSSVSPSAPPIAGEPAGSASGGR